MAAAAAAPPAQPGLGPHLLTCAATAARCGGAAVTYDGCVWADVKDTPCFGRRQRKAEVGAGTPGARAPAHYSVWVGVQRRRCYAGMARPLAVGRSRELWDVKNHERGADGGAKRRAELARALDGARCGHARNAQRQIRTALSTPERRCAPERGAREKGGARCVMIRLGCTRSSRERSRVELEEGGRRSGKLGTEDRNGEMIRCGRCIMARCRVSRGRTLCGADERLLSGSGAIYRRRRASKVPRPRVSDS